MSTAGVNVSVDARMPGTVESTNGSKAPDGSIQWKIDYSEATDKVLTVKSSTPNWVGVIGVGVLVLLVLGGVIVALLRRRGKPVPMVQTDSTEA
jgi:hypothetical protein